MSKLEKLFENILERDEKIVKIYKPNKKAYRTNVFIWALIPLTWPFYLLMLTIGLPIFLPIYKAYYNKRGYAITNKRIIVRGGIIGVDFKVMSIESMNASVLKVGFIDKVARANTGTIEFGSQSTPIGARATNGGAANPFIFAHIQDPYKEHKEIQEHVDKVRESKRKVSK